MAYEVLARKWRPRIFDDVVGQQHVLQVLSKAFENERVHHAYLFTGTRGVGKTTLARIVAKCLNCAEGIQAKPCGTCEFCVGIDDGKFPDLVEIDAASRTRVEEMRELLSDTSYAPTHGRFKVYLIDEVHMLSQSSFNALLKTLEEPPAHVKFLLATTDPQKLPATILSRCLQFHLKRLTPAQISEQLCKILEEDSVSYEEAAVAALGRAADGSMRDGLSLLDQAINYCAEGLTQAELDEMLGLLPQESFNALVMALASRDPKTVMQAVASLREVSPSFQDVLTDLAAVFHACAMNAGGVDADAPQGMQQQVEALNAAYSPADLQLGWQILLQGRQDLPLAPDEQIGLEMTLLRLLCFMPTDWATQTPAPPASSGNVATEAAPEETAPAQEATTPRAVSAQWDETVDWNALIGQMEIVGATRVLAKHCIKEKIEGENLHLLCEQDPSPTKEQKQKLEKALCEHFDCPIKLHVKMQEASGATLAQQEHQQRVDKQAEIQREQEEAEVPRALQEELGARPMSFPATNMTSPVNGTKS